MAGVVTVHASWPDVEESGVAGGICSRLTPLENYSLKILFATCSDAQIANQVGNDFEHGGRAAGDGLSCKPQ
jgi:hypothetical protein